MKSRLTLTVLACALGAAGVATAQVTSDSKDIPPPNDIIRLPSSVTTPDMPIVVSPPRDDIGRRTAPVQGSSRQVQPVIRSLGADSSGAGETQVNNSTVSGAGTPASDGAAARPANPSGTRSVNGATSSAGSGGPTNIGGVNGSTSSAGLNGGITPSSGGKAGIFGTSSRPAGGAGTETPADATGNSNGTSDNADTGNNATGGTISGGQGNAPGASGTVPAGRAGVPMSNGATGSKGSSSSGK